VALCALLTLCACGSGEPLANTDLTLTARDPAFNFSTVTTYALPSTVQVVSDSSTPPSSTTISAANQTFILSQVASHMSALGLTQLTNTSGPKPSVFVDVAVMQTVNTDVYYTGWYGYWGTYYAPWYGASFAGYAPYGYPYVVQTTLGSLIVNWTDPNNPNTSTGKIPSPWVAVLNGAVTGGSDAAVQARVQSGLDEAFSQSPYLVKGAS
jgi:hypothetical protein